MTEKTIKTKIINTDNTESQPAIASEPLFYEDNGSEKQTDIKLHKVAKTGKLDDMSEKSYNNLDDKPNIPNPADYYWANVKVSASSSDDTVPTFREVTTSALIGADGGDLSITTSGANYNIVMEPLGTGQVQVTGNISAYNFYASSDKRLKENIVEYKPEKSILDLPIYKYDFIDGQKNQIGCLAQDLKEICPEIVYEKENGYLSIQESKIVYLLLEEVKKLKKEVEELKRGK